MAASINPKTAGVVSALEYTWANKPVASSANRNMEIFVSDIPVGIGSRFVSNGSMWVPIGGEVVLGQSGVAGADVTGTTSSVTSDLLTIPGGLLGPNGALIIEGAYSMTTNANNKTTQMRFASGPTRVFGATLGASVPAVSFRSVLQNRGSESINTIHYNLASGIGGGGTFEQSTLNTSVDQVLQSLIQLAVGTDTCKLERWAVVARPF